MRLNRRQFNQFVLVALSAGYLSPAFADLVEGKDWRAISPPQPGDTPGKTEVLEFFSYGCPHCATLNPLAKTWAEKLPTSVTFRRVPVTFGRAAWGSLARLYYSLESSGDLARLDQDVFDALHREKLKLWQEDEMLTWLEGKGVDTNRFLDVFNSFDVQTQLGRSDYLTAHYQIDAVPTITVAGRYAVLGRGITKLEDIFVVADGLITKAQQGAAGA